MKEARRTAQQATRIAQEGGARLWELMARIALARVLLAAEGAEAKAAIEAELERARELVDETGARALEPQVLEQRAELTRLLGDETGYRRALREAHRLFAEIGATGHVQRVAAQLKSLPG